jgi:uncharacterized membrane protein
MKALAEFARTTLIGGVLVLLPVYLLLLVLLKMLTAAMQLISPIMAGIPATASYPALLTVVVIVAACFLAGLVVRTGPGRRVIDTVQRQLLEKIPGYKLLRNLVSRVGGDQSIETFSPALVEIEEALVPAVIVEELPDGQCVVLVPSVPTPFAGALYILPAARVHRVNVPLRRLLQVYSKWGEGAGELVAAMEPARPSRPV